MVSALLPVYASAPVRPVRGSGVWLFDDFGAKWLDCVGGIATNALGHCHPRLVNALKDQAERLWHVSNALSVPGQEELATRLTAASFADTVFFANSGTEAVEAAIKMARRYHAGRGDDHRIDIIGLHGSFHGRTYAGINAAGNPEYLKGFGPPHPGYVHVPADDPEALERAIARPSAAALILEPVQGEGGARAFDDGFLLNVRRMTRDHGVLLIHDEVQSGMGRTGRLFAHQWVPGAEPDIMALAKALGAGFPVGACLATREASSGMARGAHGSTFGGNPLAMAVASAAFDEIATDAMARHVAAMSDRLREGLAAIAERYPDVLQELRGKGLLIGLKLHTNNREFVAAAREQYLLIAGGGDNCVRLLPPLIINAAEADEVIARIDATCATVQSRLRVTDLVPA